MYIFALPQPFDDEARCSITLIQVILLRELIQHLGLELLGRAQWTRCLQTFKPLHELRIPTAHRHNKQHPTQNTLSHTAVLQQLTPSSSCVMAKTYVRWTQVARCTFSPGVLGKGWLLPATPVSRQRWGVQCRNQGVHRSGLQQAGRCQQPPGDGLQLFNGRGGMPTFPQVLVCLPETNPLTKVYTVVRGRSAVISLLHSSPVHGRCPTALSCLPVEGPPASNHSSTAGWT